MKCERQIADHLDRALVETLFAIAEFDHMRAQARANGGSTRWDSLAGMLLMLRSALDSAIKLTRDAGAAPGSACLPAGEQSIESGDAGAAERFKGIADLAFAETEQRRDIGDGDADARAGRQNRRQAAPAGQG